ncbi:MAG: tyrosine--tRNA ligase [bacterium]
MVDTDIQKINTLLGRGTEDVFVKDDLLKKLSSGKQLRIKFGIDPTGPKIHIGRAAVLRKLKAFQDLGHQIVLIIGDFTAQIGDASDKSEKRPMLSKEQVNENFKAYKEQIGKILDISKVEFRYNSDWLATLSFAQICELAEVFTVQQMISRRNFKERIENGNEISLREFMYPLMQGYDSVMVEADVEIGGFDQLFNLKAGRIMQKHFGKEEQNVLTVQMLEGTDGRKMSTSWGNVITITDEPNDMFGHIMSVKDELIPKYFLLATDVVTSEIEIITKAITDGANPMIYKKQLAKEIVALYHGADAAQNAYEHFENTFSKGEIPELADMEVAGETQLVEICLHHGLVSSKGEFARLIESKSIEHMDSEKIVDDKNAIAQSGTYRIGKKRFIKIKVI